MNKTLGKLTLAAALALVLGAGSAAQAARPAKINAAAHGRVMVLGTIRVTAADAEGKHRYGSTMYLGSIQVTAADSEAARYAAREAAKTGAVYLGSIEVTANDSEDARIAAASAAANPNTAYLGSVRVTPSKLQAPVLVGARLSRLAVLKIVGMLAFGRAGG
jgi:hypothetical protein